MKTTWTENQQKAIELTDRNILVSAAAGSGKTAVLVERIVSMISSASGNGETLDIDKMVIVTFTNAAAAEMKARIRTELSRKLEDNPTDTHLIKQITLLNNAQITTIDSFCLWIIRNHFSEINLDPGFKTADMGELRLIESDICEQLLEDYYDKQDESFFNLVDSYNNNKSDERITEIILNVYKAARSNPWPEEWLDKCTGVYLQDTDTLLDNEITRLYFDSIIKSLKDYKEKYEKLISICCDENGPRMYLDAIQSDYIFLNKTMECRNFNELADCVGCFEFETLGRKKYPDVDEEKKEFVKEQRNKFKNYIIKQLKKVFPASNKEMTVNVNEVGKVLTTLIELVRDFMKRISQEKRDRGIIDFNDMEHMALDILVKKNGNSRQYTETADILAKRFTHILIDEYQDSNALQEEIMFAVSRERLPEYNNNMYMVGDVKQSIYRFRQACPELFVGKYNSYTRTDSEYQVIELTKNFRSRKNVLNCVNDVFKRVINKNFCGIEYNENNQLNAAFDYPVDNDVSNFGREELCSTEIHLIKPVIDEDMTKRECEALYIAGIIRSLMGLDESRNQKYVYDKETDGYRPIEYRDIVVLTRAVTDWADIFVDVFTDNGIPAMCDVSEGYFNVREIRLLLNFLEIIDNPVQDIPLAAVMLSYFGHFNASELANIRLYCKSRKCSGHSLYDQIVEMSEASRELMDDEETEVADKCKAFLDMLRGWRIKTDYLGVYDILWEIIYDTGYYDYVGMMPAGMRRRANLDILLEKSLAFEKTSYSGLFNFLRYIDRLQRFEVDFSEGDVSSNGDNLVRVMSIHKSKGLEFPVVILAGMHKEINQRDKSGGVIIDQSLGIGADYINLEKRTKSSTIIKNAIADNIGRETIAEEQRVLYVAMTRAREKLYMTGIVDIPEKFLAGYRTTAQELTNTGILCYSDNENLKNYFDMVMPVALMPDDVNTGTFNVITGDCKAMVDSPDYTLPEEDADWDNEDTKKTETDNNELSEELYPKLKEYIPPDNADSKVKVTVSELKQMQHEADFEADAFMEESLKDASDKENELEQIIPQFISGVKETLAANERGTAYHRVMECIDMSAVSDIQDVETEIERLVAKEKLSRMQADCIKPMDIFRFINSDIAERIIKAQTRNNVYKEQPFVFEYSSQLIQGVVDLYFIEDDGITIVDYKTDRVPVNASGEDELRKRYTIQLDYYAKALTQITGLTVKEKVIYSFTLGKCISV
ncbi:MAG: helicase-exonuclease AddAB subunit AddA [Lachnospira sp.]